MAPVRWSTSRSVRSIWIGSWASPPGERGSLFGHPAGVDQRPAQQYLGLRVQTAELVVGPPDQRVVNLRIDPQQDLTPGGHA